MPDPGTVYLKDGNKDEAVHVDVRGNWVYYQTRIDGNVYSHYVPKEDVKLVKKFVGTIEDCDSIQGVEPGCQP